MRFPRRGELFWCSACCLVLWDEAEADTLSFREVSNGGEVAWIPILENRWRQGNWSLTRADVVVLTRGRNSGGLSRGPLFCLQGSGTVGMIQILKVGSVYRTCTLFG